MLNLFNSKIIDSKPACTLDHLLEPLFKPLPHETSTHVEINGAVAQPSFHFSYNEQKSSQSLTIIVAPWAFPEKYHKQLIACASRKSHVLEFLWRSEAISADIETTAKSYSSMIDSFAQTLKQIASHAKDYTICDVQIIACSAGVPIVTGGIKQLDDEGNNDALEQINAVTLVGMADSFADCYLNGSRTKHIGEIARAQGYTPALIQEKFRHMAPIDGIPALGKIKGTVTWITSYDDSHFPKENQLKVMEAIRKSNSPIRTLQIPYAGHIGMSALYYVLGAGLTKHKSIRKFIVDSVKTKLNDYREMLQEGLLANSLRMMMGSASVDCFPSDKEQDLADCLQGLSSKSMQYSR